MTLLSAFSGGLFIIPSGLFLLAFVSFYKGYKQSKSGSLEEGATSGSTRESNINVPFWKCTATIYGYILTIVAIAATLGILHEA